MFERPQTGERALLVHLSLKDVADSRDLEEFQELASSAGVQSIYLITGQRRVPDARLFVGSGKAEEIRCAVLEKQVEVVIFDHELTPSQERNLEALLQCRVLDRTGLILDIFAQRARSFEGKLQVELAQLEHISTRLVRGWTHLERQKGGIGLRGPGETQLETDRRLLANRIRQIKQRLQRVDKQRDQGRQARRKQEVPTVSLVGYTNAGKSTLFNGLTRSHVYSANQLFATLDPTLRRLDLPGMGHVVLTDTVGFISHLPHELVAAFRATLQETCEASLLLEVIDTADPRWRMYGEAVQGVLESIGAHEVPRIRVFNKIDLLDEEPRLERNGQGEVQNVHVSAVSGAGLDLLRDAIAERVCDDTVRTWIHLPPEAGRQRAKLFSLGAVVQEHHQPEGGWLIQAQTSHKHLQQLCVREGFKQEWMIGSQ